MGTLSNSKISHINKSCTGHGGRIMIKQNQNLLDTEPENSAGDFNQDGELDVLDVVAIVNFILEN